MTNKAAQLLEAIVNEIERLYCSSEHRYSQKTIVNMVNQKFEVSITVTEVSNITQQLGFSHTVKENESETVIIQYPASLIKKAEAKIKDAQQ